MAKARLILSRATLIISVCGRLRGKALSGRPMFDPGCISLSSRRRLNQKWKFTKTGEDGFASRAAGGRCLNGTGDAFTLLTTAPGPEVAPIHDRLLIVLEPDDWAAWLDLTKPEAELL